MRRSASICPPPPRPLPASPHAESVLCSVHLSDSRQRRENQHLRGLAGAGGDRRLLPTDPRLQDLKRRRKFILVLQDFCGYVKLYLTTVSLQQFVPLGCKNMIFKEDYLLFNCE